MAKEINILQLPPLGKVFTLTGKSFLSLLNEKLSHLDIDRDYYALILIEKGNGFLTQNELAGKLETDKVSVVRIVNYLTGKGYVERIENVVDKRKYCLTLTDKAKKVLPGIKKSMHESTETAFGGLTGTQREEFMALLGQIKSNLSKAKNIGL
ncbi:MAG TPA: MarR family transcriptional regulator [Prolixibacteraceae bacterium]|nr:MarR family transcriptional regulator [Prolixibacteraceae bacterium]